MNWIKRAFRSISYHKKNTILMFLSFLILSILILFGLCIRAASRERIWEIRTSIGGSVLVSNERQIYSEEPRGVNSISHQKYLELCADERIRFGSCNTVTAALADNFTAEIMDGQEENGTIAGKGAEGDVRGSFSKYADLTQRAIHVQKTIIRKLADRESCVIIGRSADYILKEQKPILRIFIYSPEDVRIENVMKSHNFSAEDAKLFITEKDKRYHKRHLALTGSNRGDRHNRDMLIDSSLLGVDGTAELIEEVAKKVFHE